MTTTRYPVDPKLPARFDCTPNDERPRSHERWWHRPYVETYSLETWERHYAAIGGEALRHWLEKGRSEWLAAWPGGVRYDVRCLDGGAWDRSTCWGWFATLEEAFACCAAGPAWRTAGRAHVRMDDGTP